MNIGTISYLLAFTAFSALSLLLITSWRGRRIGIWILLAGFFSAVWAGVSATATHFELPVIVPEATEVLRNIFWCLFLLQLLRPDNQLEDSEGRSGVFETRSNEKAPSRPDPDARWTRYLVLVFALTIPTIFLGPSISRGLGFSQDLARDASLIAWVAMAVFALLMIEQLYRNASPDQRWAIKYLCLGLGGAFAFDFYMFADALLFKHLDTQLWTARGVINAIAVPLIAVSVARNPSWSLHIHVSRQVVFHSVTLVGAGVYLLVMAGAGYLLKFYGGVWGGLLQIVFLVGTGALLIALLFSDQIRAKTRVLLSKHFFSFKYDYRNEWQRFSETLADNELPVPQRVVHAMSALVNSPGGILWARHENDHFVLLANCNMPDSEIEYDGATQSLIGFLESSQWIVDLPEYISNPSLYQDLDAPLWLCNVPDAWLVVPMFSREKLTGILLLKRSDVENKINWEDRDLLKMAGQQAASHLAQHLSDKALMQARQFEAFNRLSAYVVHDLKNILAQQALIVSNAEKHKSNPAFIDDVIATVKNSVERMTRLMEQMRSGMRGTETHTISLNALLTKVVSASAKRKPIPSLELPTQDLALTADPEQLSTVFNHLIQNAQEATPEQGSVTVRLRSGSKPDEAIVEVVDTGCGMDKEFIQHRLFRPFDSTKGLTGMGIGVFESREVVRSLGGEIAVKSTPNKGSEFLITLPLMVQDSGQ